MKLTIPLLLLAFVVGVSCSSESVTLTKNSKAKSRIVIPENPSETESYSAKVLQDHLQQITGATLAIVSDATSAKRNDIQLGRVHRPETTMIDFGKLEEDGFVVQTKNGRLIIAGGSEQRTLYGVYSFLEKHLGCTG